MQILECVHFFFSLLMTVLYPRKGPLSKFQPEAPHNLNPPCMSVSGSHMKAVLDIRIRLQTYYPARYPNRQST